MIIFHIFISIHKLRCKKEYFNNCSKFKINQNIQNDKYIQTQSFLRRIDALQKMKKIYIKTLQQLKRQIKVQPQQRNTLRHMLVFNLPQDSDSQSDYIPHDSEIGEIQNFKYDHSYFNKLRSRVVQDRQTFGFREIIINYPSLSQISLKKRQRKAVKRLKTEMKGCKKIKFEQNQHEIIKKIEHCKGKQQKQSTLNNIKRNGHEFLKIENYQKSSPETEQEFIIPRRHRRIKKIYENLLFENVQITIQIAQDHINISQLNMATKNVQQNIRQIANTTHNEKDNDSYQSDSPRQFTQSQQWPQN